jgi:hypothetical protein
LRGRRKSKKYIYELVMHKMKHSQSIKGARKAFLKPSLFRVSKILLK